MGDIHTAGCKIQSLLKRHLQDEEDLIVPIILHHKLRGSHFLGPAIVGFKIEIVDGLTCGFFEGKKRVVHVPTRQMLPQISVSKTTSRMRNAVDKFRPPTAGDLRRISVSLCPPYGWRIATYCVEIIFNFAIISD